MEEVSDTANQEHATITLDIIRDVVVVDDLDCVTSDSPSYLGRTHKCSTISNASSGTITHESNSICLETTPRLVQQLMAEVMGSYLLLLIGFVTVVVNIKMDKIMTVPGVAILWGLDVMVMIYTVGHVSGAHFNPAVTIGLASSNKFAWKHVVGYICCQLLGSTLASATIQLMFNRDELQLLVTVPSGSYMQSLGIEFLITFYLMFAVSGAAFDHRAPKQLAGLVVGGIVTINSLFAGPISGASMNPARSLGPAIVSNYYTGIWVYMVGPIAGSISGCWAYNVMTFSDKSLDEAIKRISLFKQSAKKQLLK